MRQPAMEQIPEDPVSVQKFRKEPGPWDPIRLSGDTGKTPRNPPLPDADNQTSRLPHTLQYEIRSPDGNSSIAVQLDQSLSSDSGYGTSTSSSTGPHETQNPTSTVPTTTKASFAKGICEPSKSLDKESRWFLKIIEGHALRRSRSLELDTRSRDPLHLIVCSFPSNMPWLVYRRVASLTDLVPSRTEIQLHR